MRTEKEMNNYRKIRSREKGQAAILLTLALGIFLLGMAGFAIDGTNLWFHRQAAQTAADAACTAGIMDMYNATAGAPANASWDTGSFLCSGTSGSGGSQVQNSTFPPCRYAAFNGYGASALTANQPGVDVLISFPTSFSGVGACTGTPPPAFCSATGVATPTYMQVNITDRVQTSFIGMLTGRKTVDVGAQAMCGLLEAESPIPILILNPTDPSTFSDNGNVNLSIAGGPPKSIQVNSSCFHCSGNNSYAVVTSGSSGVIDLSQANGGNGGTFNAVSAESDPFAPAQTGGATLKPTPSSTYVSNASFLSDPFATIPAPTKTGLLDCSTNLTTCVTPNDNSATYGCPIPTAPTNYLAAGYGCDHYRPGYYSQGITIDRGKDANGGSNGSYTGLAVFEPGVYWLGGSLNSTSTNSCMRPGYMTNSNNPTGSAMGDGSGGMTFYFGGSTATLNVGASSGNLVIKTGSTVIFDCQGTATAVATTQVQCIQPPNTGWTHLPAALTALTGNVLLGPCVAPSQGPSYSGLGSTYAGGYNYGDPLGTTDPVGEQRGMLFFQNRDTQLANNNMPTWGGGGGFGVVGNMYFHRCNSSTVSGGGSAANCQLPPNGYTDVFTMGGGSSSNTWVVGNIVTDKLSIGGGSTLNMELNPASVYYTLRASLLQ